MRGFEPRFSVRGPLKRDRVFLAQDFQFRYVATPVKSLPGEPEIKLKSFDSFTRVDTVISARHTLGGGLIVFPREVTRRDDEHVSTAGGDARLQPERLVDRRRRSAVALAPTSSSKPRCRADGSRSTSTPTAGAPMVYAPQTQSGSFFNDQEREVAQPAVGRGAQHLAQAGAASTSSSSAPICSGRQFNGFSASRPVEIRRLDGSLAERTVFGARTEQDVSAACEFALFAQDRWRVGLAGDVRAGAAPGSRCRSSST